MPIVAKNFSIDSYHFNYTPLMLTPAKKLFAGLVKKLGPTVASILESFKLSSTLDKELDSLIEPILNSIGSAIREFSYAMDSEWYSSLIDVFIPQLEIRNEQGNMVPIDKNWLEIEFATNLSVDLQLILKCLEIQYYDFFVRAQSLSNTIGTLKNTIKQFNSQKD